MGSHSTYSHTGRLSLSRIYAVGAPTQGYKPPDSCTLEQCVSCVSSMVCHGMCKRSDSGGYSKDEKKSSNSTTGTSNVCAICRALPKSPRKHIKSVRLSWVFFCLRTVASSVRLHNAVHSTCQRNTAYFEERRGSLLSRDSIPGLHLWNLESVPI